ARAKQAAAFRVPDERRADPAFYRIRRIAAFDLGQNQRRRSIRHAVEADERRATDRLGIVFEPFGHNQNSRLARGGWAARADKLIYLIELIVGINNSS